MQLSSLQALIFVFIEYSKCTLAILRDILRVTYMQQKQLGVALYIFAQMRGPLLKASTAPALALPNDDSDVNVLVYIVD